MNANRPELEWFEKADDDLQAARRLLEPPKPLTWVSCFHAHKCAEMYLNGFLVSRRVGFRYVPDLVDLTQLCMDLRPAFAELVQVAPILMRYGAEICYPIEQAEDPDEDEAWEAVRLAEKVAAFVRQNMQP